MIFFLKTGWTALMLLLLLALPALADSGVQGRVAWRGELIPDIRVRAYPSIADIGLGKELAVSNPSDMDGTYRLALPPGEYYLTARDYEDTPKANGHFCYYSGAPVRVNAGAFTNVGFNLVKIPAATPPDKGDQTGIRGQVSYQGEPLEECYLYVYKDSSKGFKGPAYFVQPVAKGSFRLRLPPGEYYFLARKRARGGQFGPIEIGDYFNYYYGNPVRIEKGEMHEVQIETISRLSMLEEGENTSRRTVTGTIFNPQGQPAAEVRVFAYRQSEMTGTPELFSHPTDANGQFSLPLPDDGPWYLLAREHFGGPAEEGEWVGRYGGTQGQALTLTEAKPNDEVTIHVERKIIP